MTYEYQKNAAGEFVCGICNAVKKNQNTMHYHIKSHAGKYPFSCKICKKGFLQNQSLLVHTQAMHSTDNPTLKCPCCPFETLTKSNRIIHYVRKHCSEEIQKALRMNGDQFQCGHCEKEMKSSTAFHYHVAGCIQLGERQAELVGIM